MPNERWEVPKVKFEILNLQSARWALGSNEKAWLPGAPVSLPGGH